MHLFEELHVYHDQDNHSAALNMAIDEALFHHAAAPSLRFYGWEKPSLSFGYFGEFADVAHHGNDRDLVRRWTGGGIVLHGTDLTYSLVVPSSRARPLPAARVIYTEVHQAIRRALAPHLAVELAATDAPKISDACFANPVAADVLAAGKKIAGAAQRRTRAGLLQQGSIQYAPLPDTFPSEFARALCPNFTRKDFPAGLWQEAQRLASEKYGGVDWLQQR